MLTRAGATTAEPEDIVAAVLATPDGSAARPNAAAPGCLDPAVASPRLDLFEAA